MRSVRAAATAAVLVLALAAGACGGGGDDTAGDTSKKTTTTADSGATGDTTDLGAAAGLIDEDCRFLLAGAFVNPLAATVPGATVDFGDQAQQLEAIAASAPAEIKDALQTISDGWAQMAEALQGVDLTDPQSFADPEVQAKMEGLNDVFNDDFEAASTAVSEYVAANCG